MSADEGQDGRGDQPLPNSIETALPVAEVREEYEWVARFTCGCGRTGSLQVGIQRLIEGEAGRKFDELECTCSACGAKHAFFFDVTSLFESYSRLLRPASGEDREAQT